jgi:hypothetical protein
MDNICQVKIQKGLVGVIHHRILVKEGRQDLLVKPERLVLLVQSVSKEILVLPVQLARQVELDLQVLV